MNEAALDAFIEKKAEFDQLIARRAQRGSLLRRRARGDKLGTRQLTRGVDGLVAARGRRGVRGGGACRAQGRHGTARRAHGQAL